jgi:predicted nucleotidyltransferase
MTELAMLAKQIGVNERTLRRSVNEGTLRASRLSPRQLELSPAEREYARRRWPLIGSLRALLRTEPNVRFALLFGSTAAGTDTPRSDVDILVDMADGSLDRVVDLTLKLEAAVGKPVDLVRLEDAERDSLFLAKKIASGRVLVDRDQEWSRLSTRKADLLERGLAEKDRRAHAALEGIDRMLAA